MFFEGIFSVVVVVILTTMTVTARHGLQPINTLVHWPACIRVY